MKNNNQQNNSNSNNNIKHSDTNSIKTDKKTSNSLGNKGDNTNTQDVVISSVYARNKLSSTHNPSLTLQASINDTATLLLVDCGATRSLISTTMANRLRLALQEAEKPYNLQFGNGDCAQAKHEAKGRIAADQLQAECTFLVTDSIPDTFAILGLDFLISNDLTINFSACALQKDKLTTPLTLQVLPQPPGEKVNCVFVTYSQLRDEIERKPQKYAYCGVVTIYPDSSSYDEEDEVEPPLTEVLKSIDNTRLEGVLRNHAEIFVEKLPLDRQPNPAGIIHRIDTYPDRPIPRPPPRRLTQLEREEVDRQVTEMLNNGTIRPSRSPYNSQVVLAKRKDGAFRLCMNYKQLNDITVPVALDIANQEDIVNDTCGAQWFSTLDAAAAFHQIPILEEHKHKTAFSTAYGNKYEFNYLCFGLGSAAATQTELINKVLKPVKDFAHGYVDDIIVWSREDDVDSHIDKLERVLHELQRNNVYLKASKCKFLRRKVPFLGRILSHEGVSPDPDKVACVRGWQRPEDVKQLRSFLGLTGYLSNHISGYADIARPLHDLLRVDRGFVWDGECDVAFNELKTRIVSAPTLRIPNCKLGEFTIYCDASDYAIGGMLEQEGHPVAFTSRRQTDTETRYAIREKEALALVHCLKAWEHLIHGSKILLKTDHSSLVHVFSGKQTSHRLARWWDYVQTFGDSLKIEYIKGETNVSDCISRLRTTNPDRDMGVYSTPVIYTAPVIVSATISPEVQSRIKEAYKHDPVYKQWTDNPASCPDSYFISKDGLIFRKPDQLCIPADLRTVTNSILRDAHDAPSAAHPGPQQTFENIRHYVYWDGIHNDAIQYAKTCPACQKSKHPTSARLGLMHSAPRPAPYQIVHVDFMEAPVSTARYNAITVVVDRMTRRTSLIAGHKDDSAKEIAAQLWEHVFALFGLPDHIVSDRDSRLTGTFWTELTKILGITAMMTTSYHQQANGQVERRIRVVKERLRTMFDSINPVLWHEHLPALEYALNNEISNATKFSPTELLLGRPPRIPWSTADLDSATSREDVAEFLRYRHQLHRAASATAELSTAAQKKQYDKHRRDHNIAVGDQVLLETSVLPAATADQRVTRGKAKMIDLYHGPYDVVELTGTDTFKLLLPPEFGIAHPEFHVSKMKRYYPSPQKFGDRSPASEEIEAETADTDSDSVTIPTAGKPEQGSSSRRSPTSTPSQGHADCQGRFPYSATSRHRSEEPSSPSNPRGQQNPHTADQSCGQNADQTCESTSDKACGSETEGHTPPRLHNGGQQHPPHTDEKQSSVNSCPSHPDFASAATPATDSSKPIRPRCRPQPRARQRGRPPKRPTRTRGVRPVVPSKNPSKDLWQIQDIVDERRFEDQQQYKVSWAGYPESHDSWEPADHLNPAALKRAHQLYPSDSRTTRRTSRRRGKEG